MNKLQINELKRQGLIESMKPVNVDKMVFVLVKNGTNFGKITSDPGTCIRFIKNNNYSLYFRFLEGVEIPVETFNIDSLQESVNFEWFSTVGCYEMDKLQQVDFLIENCGYNYGSAWMLVYGE